MVSRIRMVGQLQGDPEGLGQGYVDLDFGSSLGWWAATIATYCPSRMMEHLKSISTKSRSETFWVTLYGGEVLTLISLASVVVVTRMITAAKMRPIVITS